jgi:1,4-alpha-glucan branching enzyme
MKPKDRIKHGPSPTQHQVRIEFHHDKAQAVFIAGTFNEWHPGSTPMIHLEAGRWIKELVLPPGRYEYLFVVDGVWVNDPSASEQVPNPHGGHNSVLVVPEAEKQRTS